MRRLLHGALMLALAGSFVLPALAEEHESKMTVHGELWSRTEYLENFTDFDDTTNDNLDFTSYRARVDVDIAITDEIGACIEVQNFGVWGNTFPFDANAQDPNLGTAQLLTNALGQSDTVLYQAAIKIKNVGGSPISFTIGRQEHVLGNELHLGDNDFYGGQSFDGIRATFDFEGWDLDAFWYKIQERSIAPGSLNNPGTTLNGGSDDSDLAGVTASLGSEAHVFEPYFLYKRDGAEGGTINGPQYYTYTGGILYRHPRGDENILDWSVEAAMQQGEINSGGGCPAGTPCDISSYIAEAEVGLSLGGERNHRFAVGGLLIGDGDDAQDSESFMSLFPDTHRRAGAMDIFTENSTSGMTNVSGGDTFHNLTNYYGAYQWTGGAHGFTAAFHFFQATEDSIVADGDYGQEIDVIYDFRYREHVGVQVGFGQFMPGDEFTAPDDEDAMRGWAMLRVRG